MTLRSWSLSILLVLAAAWAASIPWSMATGPADPLVVVLRALGAAAVPAVVGWFSLWRTRGDVKAGVRNALWAAFVLFGVVLVGVYLGS